MDKLLKRLGNAIFYAVIGFFLAMIPIGCEQKEIEDENAAFAMLIIAGLFALAGFGYGLATDDD